jgi:thiosulfate/3-mercaptopyruvate sulfurtransferase
MLHLSSLVDTNWLAEHLTAPGLRIVDARWRGDESSRALFRQGHIPGAVHLDWHFDLNTALGGVRDLLLPPTDFKAVMQAAGIGDDTAVVAYAETDYSGAARLWWALRYYGHPNVAVLDGGLTKWIAEGRPLSVDSPRPSPVTFTPRPQPGLLATADEILSALEDPAAPAAIVDARPPEQYEGQAVWTPPGSRYLPPGKAWIDIDGRRLRGGRIPGAVSLPSTGNFDPHTWTLLPPDVLSARAQAAGVQPGQRVILYCGVGISASMSMFALHLAGYPDLALYDASWDEWGHDPHLPVTVADLTTPVTRHLDLLRLPYRLFHHPGPVNSLAQAALERGQEPEQVVRSILFRLAEEQFVMVLIAGPAQISWPRLRAFLGISRLTMASEVEVLEATGYPLGAVSPFGLPAPMRTLLDKSVLHQNIISLGSGLRGMAVIMRSADLHRGLGEVEIGDFAS